MCGGYVIFLVNKILPNQHANNGNIDIPCTSDNKECGTSVFGYSVVCHWLLQLRLLQAHHTYRHLHLPSFHQLQWPQQQVLHHHQPNRYHLRPVTFSCFIISRTRTYYISQYDIDIGQNVITTCHAKSTVSCLTVA